MAGETVNVLEQPVELRGGTAGEVSHGHISARGEDRVLAGGYSLGIEWYVGGTCRVQLRFHGPGGVLVTRAYLPNEGRAEFERLKAVLRTREWVEWVSDRLDAAGIVPADFLGAIRAGELESLLVAADWQDEHANPNAAILLRTAYHRIAGNANVAVRAGKGKVIVLNPVHVTPKYPAKPGIGTCRAAVIDEGKSIRIVRVHSGADSVRQPDGLFAQVPFSRVEERTFAVGSMAEYNSFNLVYFAPVETITAKTVVIGGSNTTAAKSRLSIGAFVEKNDDFDLEKAKKRNDEWTD